MGFCPPGFLSSLDFVRLDIVLWVFVQWDFVLIPFLAYDCIEIDKIASFQLGVYQVQQPVRSVWHIQDGGTIVVKECAILVCPSPYL